MICSIERSELKFYENFVKFYEIDLERLKNLKPGAKKFAYFLL